MKKLFLLFAIGMLFNCNSAAQKTETTKKDIYKVNKTDEEWRRVLTDEQFYVLREKGTERPHTGKYNLHFEKGTYACAACDAQLFESGDKFMSDCGWPSFDNAIEGTIKYKEDRSLGMVRTEILCANCGGHLGHIFNDGPTATGKRFCVNSASLNFDAKAEKN
ncbi:peptide-methionine (R)-S-oxide reductase [Flavobacteriaceae bacterium 144Ye]|nr:peptide-methionine (R)-S-oxide reductase [Flavobacteriaceae bacterium 144Ye]